MKLSQLFSGEVRADSASRPAQPTPAQAEQMNRQIRSLVPGQTISGEIVSRNGNEVQIRLSEDMLLSARVDRSMNIEIGKNMTFEVKNNGSSLTLSPLFTNVSTDVNVLKALDMAGLPVNGASVDMTEQLMAAGLPVNKATLQQIFREIGSFPQGTVSDIINLHKLQMPVNEANVSQMASYRNLNHQLVGGMDTILGALPEVFDSMIREGDMAGALKLYQEVLQLVQDGMGGLPVPEEGGLAAPGNLPAGTVPGALGEGAPQGTVIVLQDIIGEAIPEVIPHPGEGGMTAEEGQISGEGPGAAQVPGTQGDSALEQGTVASGRFGMLPEGGVVQGTDAGVARGEQDASALRAAVAGEALELLDSLQLSGDEASVLRGQILQFARGEADAGRFFADLSALAGMAGTSPMALQAFRKLLSGAGFKGLLSKALKEGWTLEPGEVSLPGRVEELYRRLDRQLKGLAQALDNAGQSESTAFRAVSSMSQNVDFLQQLNQMYAYVQLPLRLQHRDAHGDLYVYSNKKNLAGKDGNVTALLHLDMEHLGPVDVYVAMQNSKVSTKFYLRDDEMIDFVASHMDILTERLKGRGYECSFAMALREEPKSEATKGGLEPILRQDRGVMLSRYAFDVRT